MLIREVIYGSNTLPSEISRTAKFFILQGVLYASIGLIMFIFPWIYNKVLMYPEPFTDAETPMYRMFGYFLIVIGYFFITASRMDEVYWFISTIFGRIIIVPILCLLVYFAYDGPPQICITFSTLDPTLAYLSFLSLRKDNEEAATSLGSVFMEAIFGTNILPPFSGISNTAKFLILQGVCYAIVGLVLIFSSGSLFPDEVVPLWRCTGMVCFVIGYFYIMPSRMNKTYWNMITIFSRLTFQPLGWLILCFVFDVPAQFCMSFLIFDSTMASLTLLSLSKDENLKKNTKKE